MENYGKKCKCIEVICFPENMEKLKKFDETMKISVKCEKIGNNGERCQLIKIICFQENVKNPDENSDEM